MESPQARSDKIKMMLMMLGLTLALIHVLPHIGKVGGSDPIGSGLDHFLELVSSEQRVDLVILLDGSHFMTAHTFYTVQMPLIQNLIRYKQLSELKFIF